MRLARLAASGLALGVVAGFAVAFLRPRRRLVDDLIGDWPGAGDGGQGPAHPAHPDHRAGPVRSLTESTGGPIGWGTRRTAGGRHAADPAAATPPVDVTAAEPLPPLVPVVPARVRSHEQNDDGTVQP